MHIPQTLAYHKRNAHSLILKVVRYLCQVFRVAIKNLRDVNDIDKNGLAALAATCAFPNNWWHLIPATQTTHLFRV